MNGQQASTPYWAQLFEARDWSGLETWARTTDDRAALRDFWDRLNAEIPKETRVNGAETWASHVHPSHAPEEWKGAARLLEEGELEACVFPGPDPYAVLWDRELPKVEALIADLRGLPEVTKGDRERSRAAYLERVEAHLAEIRLQTAVALRQVAEEQAGGSDGPAEGREDEGEVSEQEWLRELIAAIALSAFWAGLDLRAALGKEAEVFAVTGEKVRKGGAQGNDMRRAGIEPLREAILQNMDRLIREGHSRSRAAELTARDVGGTTKGNRRLWYRHRGA